MRIFVFTTKDNKVVVGQSTNPCSAMCEWNTVNYKQMDKILGTKPKNKNRTVESVAEKFREAGHDVSIYETKQQRQRKKNSRAMDRRIEKAVASDCY